MALVVVAVELQVDAAQAPVNEVVVVVDLEEAPGGVLSSSRPRFRRL